MRFLLCDRVYKDETSGKSTLLGIWDTLHVASFPADYGTFGLYVKLTGLNGEYRFGIQCLAPDLEQVVAEIRPAAAPLVDATHFLPTRSRSIRTAWLCRLPDGTRFDSCTMAAWQAK